MLPYRGNFRRVWESPTGEPHPATDEVDTLLFRTLDSGGASLLQEWRPTRDHVAKLVRELHEWLQAFMTSFQDRLPQGVRLVACDVEMFDTATKKMVAIIDVLAGDGQLLG